MWSKKTYDILSLIFIFSLIGVSLFVNYFVDMGVDFDEPISKTNQLDVDAFVRGMELRNTFYSIPIGIYGILIIILAIQMHRRDFIPMSDTVLIILLSPLSIIWYPFVLRKHFKKIPDNTIATQSIPLTQ